MNEEVPHAGYTRTHMDKRNMNMVKNVKHDTCFYYYI